MGPGLGPSGKSRWKRSDTGALGSQTAWRYSPTLPLPPAPRQFLTFFWKVVVERQALPSNCPGSYSDSASYSVTLAG